MTGIWHVCTCAYFGFSFTLGTVESTQTAGFSGSVHGIYAWVCIFACATCVHRPALRYELFKFVHCIGIRAEMKSSAGLLTAQSCRPTRYVY